MTASAARETCVHSYSFAALSVVVSLLHAAAHAQDPAREALRPTQEEYAIARGQPAQGGADPREFRFDPQTARNELGFSIGVPLWFRHAVNPGLSLEGRYAQRFGAFAPEFTFSWQVNWFGEAHLERSMDAFFFSGGVRAYLLPDAWLSPFVSGAFDFSLWHLRGDTQTFCGYYSCGQIPDYRPNIGFSGRLGLAATVVYRLQLELGARLAVALPFGPFERALGTLTPYFGTMWRF
jgi:hypothetical protein